MASKPARILIVGAGAAGLTAAVELARQGIIADIVEKREEPSQLSRAVGILPRSMTLLEPSGAAELLRREAIAVANVSIFDVDQRIARLRVDLLDDARARLFALPQDRTEAILHEVLSGFGGSVAYGQQLTALRQHGADLVATIDGNERRYDYVLGCDGVGSRVRNELGLSYDGYNLDDPWSIADAEIDNWVGGQDFCIFRLRGRKVCIAVPIGPGRYRMISNTPDTLEILPVTAKISRLRRESAFSISVRQVPFYNVGNAYLAGDSAHCHSPAGGRGMNLGIADAAEWVQRFMSGTLDGYSASRHAAGAKVIRLSELGRKAVLADRPFARSLFFLAARTMTKITWLNRTFVRNLLDL